MKIVSLLVAVSLVGPAQLDSARESVSDSAITARIETTYTFNEHLNPFNINTTTDAGVVTLQGAVANDVQKDLAEEIAMSVNGVNSVNNELIVMPEDEPEPPYRSFRTKIDDKTTTASVRTRLMYRKTLRDQKIQVKTIAGVTTLTGLVDSDFHKEQAEYVAFQTKGVERVDNQLIVRSKEDLSTPRAIGRDGSDEFVEKRVEKSIMFNRHLSIRKVDVEVDDGVCFLTGKVNSPEERALAEVIAGNTSGVHEVRNEITVAAFDPEPDESPLDSQGGTALDTPGTGGLEPLEPADISPEVEPLELGQPSASRDDVFGDPDQPLFPTTP